MEKDFYKNLTKRNDYFIPLGLQAKIASTSLVFIGCGLASNVATKAARLGFLNFVLADGDVVDASNLNRQDFNYSDIGNNKAKALEKKLKSINPGVEVSVINEYIGVENVKETVSLGDIIINSADFNEVTYEIDRESAAQGKFSISPLNIGFGSVITCFNEDSSRLLDMTNGLAKNDKDYLLKFYRSLTNYKLPKYIKQHLAKIFIFIAKKGFFPQNVIAAETSTLLILSTIIRHLRGSKVKLAPEAIYFDSEGLYE